MNLKVGDKVTIRQWDDMAEEFGVDYDGDIKCKNIFISDMRKYCGKTFTIVDIKGYLYTLSDDSGAALKDSVFSTPWGFTEDMFEKKTAFTKDNLKSGMVAKLRDGGVCLLFGDKLIDEDGYILLDKYCEDLTCAVSSQLDIMAVYSTEHIETLSDALTLNYTTLVWERVDKMTLEQVCEELGRKIEIVE